MNFIWWSMINWRETTGYMDCSISSKLMPDNDSESGTWSARRSSSGREIREDDSHCVCLSTSWISGHLRLADRDQSKSLTKAECEQILMDVMNIELSTSVFKELFHVRRRFIVDLFTWSLFSESTDRVKAFFAATNFSICAIFWRDAQISLKSWRSKWSIRIRERIMETDRRRHVQNEDEQTLDTISMNIDELLDFLRQSQKVSWTHIDLCIRISICLLASRCPLPIGGEPRTLLTGSYNDASTSPWIDQWIRTERRIQTAKSSQSRRFVSSINKSLSHGIYFQAFAIYSCPLSAHWWSHGVLITSIKTWTGRLTQTSIVLVLIHVIAS